MTEKKAAKPKAEKKPTLTKEEKAKQAADKKTAAAEAKKGGGKALDGTLGEPYTEVQTEHLLCTLTAEERLEKLEESNRTLKDIQKLKMQGKAAASEYNAQAREREGHLKTIQNQLEEGIARPVKTEVKYDFKTKVVTRTRMDTGEVVGSRPMNDYDRAKAQESLPFAKHQEDAERIQEEARKNAKPAEGQEAAPAAGGPSPD